MGSKGNIMRIRQLTALAAGLVVCTAPVTAQSIGDASFGVGAGVSTLGFYVEGDVAVTPNFHIRTPVFFGFYNGDITYEGNTGNADIDVFSFPLMGDYSFGRTGFRLSGGMSVGGYEASATFPGSITLNGRTYNATITGNLKQDNNIAPVVAMGYNHTFKNNWGLSAELGARITTLGVTATGQETLTPADRAEFERELRSINNDLDKIGVTPFLSLGVTYKF